jgi:tryptophan-rich sensory protein
MNNAFRAVVPILTSFAAGLFGSMFVGSSVDAWYRSLAKPLLAPPDLFFPFALLVCYALMGIACAIIWLDDSRTDHHASWVRFFFIHLLFNSGWTIFFFGFHSLLIATFDILFVLFLVLGLTGTAYHIDRRAAFLLMPYLAWTAYVAYLTVGALALN